MSVSAWLERVTNNIPIQVCGRWIVKEVLFCSLSILKALFSSKVSYLFSPRNVKAFRET